jgi:hypothetical protein
MVNCARDSPATASGHDKTHLLKNGREYAPGSGELVVAHEERRIAMQRIENQPLVGIGQVATVLLAHIQTHTHTHTHTHTDLSVASQPVNGEMHRIDTWLRSGAHTNTCMLPCGAPRTESFSGSCLLPGSASCRSGPFRLVRRHH